MFSSFYLMTLLKAKRYDVDRRDTWIHFLLEYPRLPRRNGESTNSEQRKNVFYDILRIREENDRSVSPK